MKNSSITFKLVLTQIVISFILLSTLVIFFNYMYKNAKLENVDSILLNISKDTTLLQEHNDVFLYTQNDNLIEKIKNKELYEDILEELEEGEENSFDTEDNYRFYIFNNNVKTILVYDLKTIYQSMEDINELLMIFSGIIFTLIAISSYIIIKKTLNPIKKSIHEIEQIKEQKDFSKSLKPLKSSDEISKLIDTFNDMLKDIDTTIKQIKQFSDDASHELKTPLTVIQGEVDLALSKDRDEVYYKQTLKNIEKQSQNLQKIINGLLLLSKTQNQIQNKYLELDFILLDCYESLLINATKKSLSIEIKLIENSKVFANDSLLRVLITNILDNAIKYSNNNSKIIISLKNDTHPILTVQDFGIGMDKTTQENIYNRFYRSNDVINNKYDGIGLGLSIVEKIINLYGWEIAIQSELNEGTKVVIEFN